MILKSFYLNIGLQLSLLIIVASSLSSCNLLEPEEKSIFDETPGSILFVSDVSGISQLYSIEPDGSDVRQITSDEGFPIYNAVWSPDKSMLVLASPVGGSDTYGPSLYICTRTGDNLTHLLRDDSGPNTAVGQDPVWSPDGKSIVFRRLLVPESLGAYETVILDIQTGKQRALWGGFSTFSRVVRDWSKDGTLIIGSTADYTMRDSLGRAIDSEFVTVWSTDGDSLYSFGEIGKTHYWPVMARSQQQIGFSIFQNGSSSMYRSLNTGSNPEKLTDGEYQFIVPIDWSPDDSSILSRGFIKDLGQWRERIVIVDVSGEGLIDISPFDGASNNPTSW